MCTTNQLEFIQELNNCIMDKTELTALIVGGELYVVKER